MTNILKIIVSKIRIITRISKKEFISYYHSNSKTKDNNDKDNENITKKDENNKIYRYRQNSENSNIGDYKPVIDKKDNENKESNNEKDVSNSKSSLIKNKNNLENIKKRNYAIEMMKAKKILMELDEKLQKSKSDIHK